MWFDTWSELVRIVAVGSAGYVALVVLLRLSGKRTLAKLNAFDFVVTVALGSTLATILLDSSVSWVDGVTALLTLVVLQLVVAFFTARSAAVRRVVTSGPTVLVWQGELRAAALGRARVSASQVHQAVRATGTGSLAEVAAVVLETDGTLSVVTRSQAGDLSALSEVQGVPPTS